MKKFFSVLLVILAVFFLAACNKEKEKTAEEKFEIAVVTDVGQLNDGGFNQGTWEGAEAYAKANKLTYKYYQPANGADATDNDRIAAMRSAIENGAKVIVTPGFLQETAIKTVAAESKDVKFIFVDGYTLGLSNVTAISYKEEESGYLAGYAAVKDGYEKLGGTFGGGGSNPACNRFAYGYVQGIAAAAAELKKVVDVKISFQYGSTFSSSTELQTQISGWYAAGTQVVFSCGGSMLQSVKAACAENPGTKIIGVDVDQAKESEAVLTSAVKGLSVSVQKVLGELYNGKWDSDLANKCSNLGAADDATGLPTADASWRFAKFTKAEYNTLFNSIKSGAVTIKNDVASDMNNAAAWNAVITDSIQFTLD